MTYQYPMERVLYNVHRQMCVSALRKTSNRSRSLAEHTLLILAVCGFGVLLLVHLSFVYSGNSIGNAGIHANNPTSQSNLRNIPLTCLPSIEGFTTEADITHISLTDDVRSFASITTSTSGDSTTTSLCSENSEATCWSIAGARQDNILLSHSLVKGFLLLPDEVVQEAGLRIQQIFVSRTDGRCFGEPFLQTIVFFLTGPDTVMLNWVLAVFSGEGYVMDTRSSMLQDLKEHGTFLRSFHSSDDAFRNRHQRQQQQMKQKQQKQQQSWNKQILAKLGVVLKTSFLFFITSTLVSFTLRETQERMLDFTHQLQARVRSRRPVVNLVTTHLADSLVFCPVMVGMIFFMNEFYRGDKAMAFMVLSVVWLCEVFSIISLRSRQGIAFFPRIFFLLFSLLHFYIFSFPFGFRHTALVSTVCFMAHSIFFFWHRFELPAFALGHVTADHPRMSLVPEPPSSTTTTTVASVVAPGQPSTAIVSNSHLRRRPQPRQTPAARTLASQQPRNPSSSPPTLETAEAAATTTTTLVGAVADLPRVPNVQLQPRTNRPQTLLSSHSLGNNSAFPPSRSGGGGSQSSSTAPPSSDDGSYLFFNGEVVMPGPQTPTSSSSAMGSSGGFPSTTALSPLVLDRPTVVGTPEQSAAPTTPTLDDDDTAVGLDITASGSRELETLQGNLQLPPQVILDNGEDGEGHPRQPLVVVESTPRSGNLTNSRFVDHNDPDYQDSRPNLPALSPHSAHS